MDCEQAIERLPWLLNRTLTPEERREVEAHLGDCEPCRTALADTRAAWEIFAQHIPTADLVAYAADTAEPTGIGRETLERHLASCPECAAELEMARSSRALAENDAVSILSAPPAARPAGTGLRLWRSSALAASLVGLVAIGGWVASAQRAEDLAGRLHAVEANGHPAAVAPSRGEPAAPSAAGSAGLVTVASMIEAGHLGALRGGEPNAPLPTLAAGQPKALLLDVDEARAAAYRRFAIVDERGAMHYSDVWQAGQPAPYSFVFDPGALRLPPGRYAIQLYGEGGQGSPLDSVPFAVAAPDAR